MKKCCGTCEHWSGPENAGLRLCEWPKPPMPFWAIIDEGNDHADWTSKDDGKRCDVWEETKTNVIKNVSNT